MIEAISHITFAVKDLQKTTQFLIGIFDAELLYSSDEIEFSIHPEKFFMIGNVWVAIMQTQDGVNRSYNHVAFKIDDAEFEQYHQRLTEHKIELLPPRSRIVGEGRSLYFYDYDNHLFELHTGTLATRLNCYHKRNNL